MKDGYLHLRALAVLERSRPERVEHARRARAASTTTRRPSSASSSLHASQYKVIDTWFAGGLRGTGSNDVEVNEQFVPEHRTLAVADTKGGPTPGSAVNPGPLFQLPVFALFPYMLSGVALGIAEGLIEDYLSKSNRTGKMTGARDRRDPEHADPAWRGDCLRARFAAGAGRATAARPRHLKSGKSPT